MNAKEIPVYFYTENTDTQVGTGKMLVYIDNDTVTKYNTSDYDNWVTLYSWQDQQLTSVGKVVNEYLGIPIINKSQTLYTAVNSPGYEYMPQWLIDAMDVVGVYGQFVNKSNNASHVQIKTLGGNLFQNTMGEAFYDPSPPADILSVEASNGPINSYFGFDSRDHSYYLYQCVRPDTLFNSDGNEQRTNRIEFQISGVLNNDNKTARTVILQVRRLQDVTLGFNPLLNESAVQAKDKDVENPYDDDGDNGGDGDNTDPTITEGTEVPGLPTIGASDFVTIYNPTGAKLNSLANFLWSENLFDLNDYKRLYEDPMECLIGLAVLPCIPTASGTKNIRFGNIDTGINCTYLSSQWAQVDCGSVNIKTTANSFMDYSPFVKLQIFLPFIGFQALDADDVMGASLKVVYNVDILSGDCVAFIRHSSRGVIYSYNGNCLCNIPMTAQSYAGAMRGYYQTLANTIPSMISGGATGGAAGAAVQGVRGLGEAGLQVMTAKPTHQRSGTMSGAASIMGVKKPFIVIERPNVSVPDYVQNYAGLSANVTSNLGSLRGFTTCDYVHIEGLKATDAELQEIENLLHSGVIL